MNAKSEDLHFFLLKPIIYNFRDKGLLVFLNRFPLAERSRGMAEGHLRTRGVRCNTSPWVWGVAVRVVKAPVIILLHSLMDVGRPTPLHGLIMRHEVIPVSIPATAVAELSRTHAVSMTHFQHPHSQTSTQDINCCVK